MLRNCNPPDLSGLTLSGWTHHSLAGHFNFFHIPFWYRTDVHDFVSLVLRSGGSYEERRALFLVFKS